MTIQRTMDKMEKDIKKLNRELDFHMKALMGAWYGMYALRNLLKTNPSEDLEKQYNRAIRYVKKNERRLWATDETLREFIKQKKHLEHKIERAERIKKGLPPEYVKPAPANPRTKPSQPLWGQLNYPVPDIFKNKYVGKTALIIASGHSTTNLLKYKDVLRKHFDVILCLNRAKYDFNEVMDFHIIMDRLQQWQIDEETYFDGKYRKDVPTILNYLSSFRYPQDLNIFKARRGKTTNIRECVDGLLMIGPENRQGLSIGTPLTQAIHFAGVLGCNKIYLSGVDLMFRDNSDHYYGDRAYRDNTSLCKQRNKSLVVDIDHNGKKITTLEYYLDSAEWINDVLIPTIIKPAGIKIYDFSGGLLRDDIQINMDEFFNSGEKNV